jgi:hypothetical protein
LACAPATNVQTQPQGFFLDTFDWHGIQNAFRLLKGFQRGLARLFRSTVLQKVQQDDATHSMHTQNKRFNLSIRKAQDSSGAIGSEQIGVLETILVNKPACSHHRVQQVGGALQLGNFAEKRGKGLELARYGQLFRHHVAKRHQPKRMRHSVCNLLVNERSKKRLTRHFKNTTRTFF